MALVCHQPECDYTRKHGPIADGTKYCPDCGHLLVLAPVEAAPAPPRHVSRFRRGAAFVLDLAVESVFDWIATFIPPVAVLATLYWLFRDIGGASPGKLACGLIVNSRNGAASTARQRIIRNLPFAVGSLPLFIPGLGPPLALFLQGALLLIETALVLMNADRLGDRFAGTKVERRSTAPRYYSAAAS